ncbi:MAG TPA: hypothetical protein VFH03_21805 [Actinoplanes sp.]|nr:hypothetical protein [Actinoplanes sp.]
MRTPGHGSAWLPAALLGAGLVTAVVVSGTAVSGTGVAAPAAAPHRAGTTAHHAGTGAMAPGAGTQAIAHRAGTAAGAAAPAEAADRAVRLQALLGQHSVLAADLMRSRIRGDDDFVQAANAALGKNTDAMTELTGQLFGAEAGRTFGPMWSEHVVSVVDYAAALADEDDGALDHAREELVEYEEDLADFFAGASQGRLTPAAARAAVGMHVDHLTGQADAYAAGDYATADRLYRTGYGHAYDMGAALADALLPAADRATLRVPVWRLRSQLGKLLAEHAVLVEEVTRAAVTNSPDFDAAAEMINANTRALASAMDTLFGAPAAKQFQSVWGSHVEQLVAYGAGAAAKDTGRQDRARAGLAAAEQQLATFLGAATGHRISDADLAAALLEHDRMLLQHADAYGARDYAAAHDLAYRTYDHMFALAKTLADAFGSTVAARLPRGGAKTGFGGLAGGTGGR